MALAFPGSERLYRQRMDPRCEFICKYPIHHAMAFNQPLVNECGRYDIDPEMALPFWPVAGMSLMQMTFINDLEPIGREGLCQLVCDGAGHRSGAHFAFPESELDGRQGCRCFVVY